MIKIIDNVKNLLNNNHYNEIIQYYNNDYDVIKNDYYYFNEYYENCINEIIEKYNNYHFINNYEHINVEIVIFNMNDIFNFNCVCECDFILFNVIFTNKYINKLQNECEIYNIDIDDLCFHNVDYNDNMFAFHCINEYNKKHNIFSKF